MLFFSFFKPFTTANQQMDQPQKNGTHINSNGHRIKLHEDILGHFYFISHFPLLKWWSLFFLYEKNWHPFLASSPNIDKHTIKF